MPAEGNIVIKKARVNNLKVILSPMGADRFKRAELRSKEVPIMEPFSS